MKILEKVIAHKSPSVIGINLGGSEHLFPAKNYSHVYTRAQKEGFRLTVHAGEAKGPKSVWDAVRLLHAERIGHGVRSIEDPSLVRYLAENKIALEVCPTSNIFTGIYASYPEHPIKKLFDAGVPITLNTDDPTFFRTTLLQEYLAAHQAGLSESDLMTIRRNGFAYSFLPEEEKRVSMESAAAT
jgi:adenosine deaminase